jgi:hypothetical protein
MFRASSCRPSSGATTTAVAASGLGGYEENHKKPQSQYSSSQYVRGLPLKLQEPCVLYIGRAYRYSPHVAFHIFFSTIISTEYFKHAAQSPFFS